MGFGGKPDRRLWAAAPRIHWSSDGWLSSRDETAVDTGLRVFITDVATGGLAPGTTVAFTMFWSEAGRWEGSDFEVRLIKS